MNPTDVIALIMALRLSRASADQLDADALEREAVLAGRILVYAQEKGTPVWSDLRKQLRDEKAAQEKSRLDSGGTP